MLSSLFTICAALFGLGLLVFLHELGHLLVARLCGIRVEVFSIGFGRAIWSRTIGGIEWKVGVFPFGGYVRLAGMEMEDATLQNPPAGSYFARPVWARIAAIAAGPLANIAICFLCCVGVFLLGGRAKSWTELSPFIGSLPAQSALISQGVQGGDKVVELDGAPYRGVRDLMLASLSEGEHTLRIQPPFWDPRGSDLLDLHVQQKKRDPLTLLWRPARFLQLGLIQEETPFVEGSPLLEAGAQVGDRLVWMDGQLLWNEEQIGSLLNDGKVLLTVERNGKRLFVRAPRIRINGLVKGQETWQDWFFDTGLPRSLQRDFWALPATVDTRLRVQEVLQNQAAPRASQRAPLFLSQEGLRPGDRILAVDGFTVSNGTQMTAQLQKRVARLIVHRPAAAAPKPMAMEQAEQLFLQGFEPEGLNRLAQGLMEGERLLAYGELVMLAPVAVKPLSQFAMSPARADTLAIESHQRRLQILTMPDGEERSEALQAFERQQSLNVLGVRAQGWRDLFVLYNPGPVDLFGDAVRQSWMTLKGIVTGRIAGHHVNSPVGVFVAMKSSWEASFAEGLYLLGFVSLSLAVFNLLPVPILDGGHIVIALVEGITGKRPSARFMKWLFIPFFAAFLALMAYTVWNDLSAILGLR